MEYSAERHSGRQIFVKIAHSLAPSTLAASIRE